MSAAGALLGFISAGDHRLMRRVHRWQPPRWIRLWMIYTTRAGDGWLWLAAGVLVLLFGGSPRYGVLGAAAVAGGASVALFAVLKRLTGRPRPCAIERHCWANLLPPDRFSFPSGHSMTAWAVGCCLGLAYPLLLPGLLFCALSIAASRIVLGLHFLSDVVAGSLLGALLGFASFACLS